MKSFFKSLSKLASSDRRCLKPAPRRTSRGNAFRPALEQLETREVPTATSLITANLTQITTINPALFAPAAPTYHPVAISGSQVNVLWNQQSNANGYLVDEWTGSSWKEIANLGSTSSSFSVTGLKTGTLYYFDVAAYNSRGTTWGSVQGATTLTGFFATINHPAAGAAYTPVSGSLFGPNGPSYTDVVQGAVGDCWLEASLAETAARDPQDIRNMFTYDGTTVEGGNTVGVYSVQLFDSSGHAHSVIVDTELPAGGGLYDHPQNGVLWVALAEKAYAEANGAGIVTTQHADTDSYAAMNYGDATWALQAITGKSANGYSINPSNIAAAWKAGELIVICTTNPVSSDIVGSHCYAVVGYNPSSSLPFEVYNPWGTNSSGWALSTENGHQVYGLFNANAAFISQNFASQAIGHGAQGGQDFQATGTHLAQLDSVFATAGSQLSQLAATASGHEKGWDSFWAEAGDTDLAISHYGPF